MIDNCPRCLRENVQPAAELDRGPEVSHLYRCDRCGHVWSTKRDVRFYGEAA